MAKGVKSPLQSWDSNDELKRLVANKESPRPDDCQLIEQALKLARPWGLEAEVMWSAMIGAVEANEHGKTMEQVLEEALGEWDL
jgi:hypothetical protein